MEVSGRERRRGVTEERKRGGRELALSSLHFKQESRGMLFGLRALCR